MCSIIEKRVVSAADVNNDETEDETRRQNDMRGERSESFSQVVRVGEMYAETWW